MLNSLPVFIVVLLILQPKKTTHFSLSNLTAWVQNILGVGEGKGVCIYQQLLSPCSLNNSNTKFLHLSPPPPNYFSSVYQLTH